MAHVRLQRAEVTVADVTVVNGFPVTTAEHTIVDLLDADTDGGYAGGVIAGALHYGLAGLDSLSRPVMRLAAPRAPGHCDGLGPPRTSGGPSQTLKRW